MPDSSNIPRDRLDAWSRHLGSMARSAEPIEVPKTHPFFVAWRVHRLGGPDTALPSTRRGLDEELWAMLGEREKLSSTDELPLDMDGDGPLREQADTRAIEVWTENELASIHALAWASVRFDMPEILPRVRRAAEWHIENTQPDNATNHAWAAHVFAVIAEVDSSPGARLYAETLLHNCMVTSGFPDALSAMILRDASEALLEIDWSGLQ